MNLIGNIIDSLLAGGIYALIALAFTLGVNICGLINFVNGELFIISIYIIDFCCSLHIPFLFSVITSMIFCAAFNIVLEFYFYRPILKRNKMHSLIVAIGLAFLIQNVFVFVFGSDPKNLSDAVLGTLKIGSIEIEYSLFVCFIVTLALMLAVYSLLKFTKLGKMIRAVSENSDSTALMGINNEKIILIIFGICAILISAASSLFYMSISVTDPYVGTMIGLRALAAAIIGGLGIISGSVAESVIGAIAGGFIVGLIETLTRTYVSTQMSDIAIFLILAVYLTVNCKKYK